MTSGSQQQKPMAAPQSPQAISSHQLLQGRNEVVIIHASQSYTLRLTRQGKLILTK